MRIEKILARRVTVGSILMLVLVGAAGILIGLAL
jgi:hypothetical protein